MAFLDLFRSKEEKLQGAIDELYINVVMATFNAARTIETGLKEQFEITLEPKAGYDLSCELFCFYAHTLDFLAFGWLGEHGRDLLMDLLVPLGIEPLVQSSLAKSSEEDREAHIENLLDRFNTMTFEYAKSPDVVVSDFTQIAKQGGIPGLTDALSTEPEAKMSRLIQNINGLLQAHAPGFGEKSELARETAEAFGSGVQETSFIVLFTIVQTSVLAEAQRADLREKTRKMRRLVR